MDAFKCIVTKLDMRIWYGKYTFRNKTKILEAARSAGAGLNTQH